MTQPPAPEPETAHPSGKHRVLLVTGVLGAGKTTALRALEDLGWETIDNCPIRLLERLIDNPDPGKTPDPGTAPHAPLALGFDSRTRGFNAQAVRALLRKLGQRGDLALSTLFLDCGVEELQRRYNETRRRHPLAADLPVATGIAAERDVMEPLRRLADTVINTTAFSANLLTQAMREQFRTDAGPEMTVTIVSFGFAQGMPPAADFVFDMRFLDNPHWDAKLRPLTGKDPRIAAFIREDPAWPASHQHIRDLLLGVLPRFQAQGKAYVTIAFGCTGGRHRSVFIAEEIATTLRTEGFSPTLLHRNLAARSADLVEGGVSRW